MNPTPPSFFPIHHITELALFSLETNIKVSSEESCVREVLQMYKVRAEEQVIFNQTWKQTYCPKTSLIVQQLLSGLKKKLVWLTHSIDYMFFHIFLHDSKHVC